MPGKSSRVETGGRDGPFVDVGAAAETVHRKAVGVLEDLSRLNCRTCLDERFRSGYERFLDLLDQYQAEVFRYHGRAPRCAKRCAGCCYHWVEDVYSFEAEFVAAYIRQRFAERIGRIVAASRDDIRAIAGLDRMVTEKLAAVSAKLEPGGEAIDSTDLLLASFHQLARPCPLLDDSGMCMVYPVRPITCRTYFSISDPKYCGPRERPSVRQTTFMLDLREEAGAMLDSLHFRYDRFGNDTGLRSVLVKCLAGRERRRA
jgi:Fe-S-cluster containining protein